MPSNQIKYTIGIDADTRQAQKSIQELQNALNAITTANNKKLGLDIDLSNAAKAAEQLQHSIQSAVNVDTGRLNFTAFNKSLMQSNTNLSQLITQLRSTGGLGNQAVSQLARSLSTAEIPIKRMTGLLGNFATTLANSFKWQISSNIIHGMQSALSSAVGYAQDLNETLNNIRIVTGQSVDDMAKFAVSANQAAKELSTTTKEFANASLIYYQQGDSAELAAKKAATTVKAANVAFTASAKEMSEMLTAVWNSYQVGEDQLERTVDVMAKLGATTASSMEEMATAMQKVASTANTVGVSMEQMSAIVATSASVTRQAPQTVGTAWNTILSRIGGLKLGETLEDGVDLNKYSNALHTVGVNILDATGNLRDMGGVIDELGSKWQTLNKGQKAALAQTIGGARQYTQIMAFFENFDKYQKNIITAQNSAGALQEQQEIYAQGWEAASKRSRAALEELWSALINDKAMISFTNGMTKMTEGVTGLVKAFGGLPGILATVSALMTRTFSNQIVNGVSKAAAGIVGFGQAFTKHGNGQPMSGGYTIGQFLTGRMPNAEERQQISNLAITTDLLSQTAKTGAGLDKENPFYNELRRSNGLQAEAYGAQIQAMRQGGNLTPIQMLNLANLQQQAEHTQNAYGALDAFHEDTSTVTSNLIATNKGASHIFAGLSKAMYREELMKIQDRAAGVGETERKAYEAQFADIARKAGINNAVFGSYKPASNTNNSDALARKFGSTEFAGLTEAERRQIIADTRQATAQSIQATRSQFNPNGQVDPSSQFKALGEAARTATMGITSGVAAFNQLNSAMAAFNSGNVVQGLTSVATTATSVAQAFIVGGPVAGAIASAGAVLGLVVGQYTADMEKAADKAKETTEKITNSTQELEAKVSNIATQSNGYNALVEQLSQGAITQDEFNNSLLTVANSLGVQGANVLALSGNYKELEEQVKQTISAQLQQAEISGKTLVSQAQDATSSTLYTAFGTYGVKTAAFTKPGSDSYGIKGMLNKNALYQLMGPNEDFSYLENILGINFEGSTSGFKLGSDFDSLSKFLHGIKQLEEEAEANFGTERGSAIYDFLNDSGFRKVRSAAETAIATVSSGLRGQYSAAGQQFVAGLNTSVLSGYNMQSRQGLIDQFLGQQGLNEENNPEAYQIGKEIISSLIDSTIAGMGAEGAKLSASASTAANKKQDYTKRLKAMGLNPDTIIGGLTDEQLNSSLGLGYWMAGGRSNINTTARDAWAISQSALEAYNNRGSNFNVGSFADQYIYSNSALSEYAGVSQEEFKKLSTDAQRHILVNWIDAIKNASDELSTAADNNDFASALTDAWNNFINDWGESIGGDLLNESQFRSILNYSKEAFTEDSQKTEDEQSDTYKLIQERFKGDYQAAQQWSQQAIDTNPALGNKASAAQDTPLGILISQAQTLADMDINDITKWKEAYEDIAQSLAHYDNISIDKWFNMSELEKRQVQLAMLQEKIQEIRTSMAKEGTGETDELIKLEYQAKQIEQTIDNIELTNFKNQMQEITDEWDKMRKNAQSALSLISSNLKNLGDLSFSDLEELRQTLLDAGLEAEHVAQILDDMRHAGEKGASKEDIWAGVMASTTAALMGITADQAQMKDVDRIVTTGTIEKIKISEEATIEPSSVTVPGEMEEVTTQGVQPPVIPTTLDANAKPVINLPNDQPVQVQLDAENNYVINLPTGTTVTVVPDANGQAIINLPTGECVIVQPDADGQFTAHLPSGEKIEVQPNADGTSTINLPSGEKIEVQPNADGTSTLNLPTGEQIIVQPDANSLAVINLPTNEKIIVALDADNKEVENKPKSTIQVDTLNAEDAEVLEPKIPTLDTDVNMNYQDGDTKAKDQLKTPLQQDVELNLKISKATYDAWLMGQNAIAGSSKLMYNANDLGKEILAGNSTETTRAAYASIIGSLRQNDLTGDIITTLTQMLQSDLPEIQQLGYWLIEGIKSGIQTEEDKANWQSFLSGLGLTQSVYDAFAKALGIASPSKLTMALAPYLIQGLQVGLTEAIAGWKPNVDGLDVKLTEAIKNSINKVKDPYEILKNKWINDQKNAGNYEAHDDLSAIYDEQWQTKKQAWINDQKKAGNYEVGEDLSSIYDRLQFGDIMHQQVQELTETEAKKILSGQGLSDNQKLAVLSAREMVDKVFDKDLNLLHGEELDEYWKLVQKYVDEYFEGLYNDSRSAEAKIKDIWVNAANLIYEYDEQKAQETYETWESTFNAIAKAREALLNGDSVLDAMLGDTDSLSYLLQYLMETKGMSYKQAQSFLNDPNADLSTLQFEAYQATAQKELMSGKLSPFYNKETGQIEVDQKYLGDEGFKNYQAEMVNRMKDVYNQGEKPFFEMLNELSSGNSNEQKAAAMLIASMNANTKNPEEQAVVFDENNGQYKLADGIKFSDVLDNQMLIAAAREAGFTSAEEYKRALFSALAQDTNAQGMEVNQIWEEQASLINSNTKELKEYAQALLEVNGDTRKLNELSQEEQKQMAGVAAKAKMAQEGWTSLATKQKDALKTIAKGQQNDLKYVDSLQSVANDVKKIFGNSKAATADFVKNHIKDIQKMANGDTKAAERVERALLESQAQLEGWGKDLNGNGLQDELNSIVDQLNTFGDEYANMPIGFEVTANTDPALASLSGLLSSGQMTAEEIQRAFELIGWEPEIAYEPVEVTEQDKSRGYATATILGKTYSTTIDESVEVGSTVQVPYIKSAKKTGGGASGSKPPKSGGSGGGGGKQHEKKDPIRPQDEIERYHEIRDQIEKLGNALDKLDKIKTKTFGQKHLEALKEEIALLKQENGLQQEYYAEAARYLAADRADLMHYGAATFNADGTVNYEEYMQNIIAEVNRRFAASESDEEDEAAQQWYDDAKKALENYEEALDLVDTTQNDILDNLNEISALTLEAAQYRLEIRVDLNDSDIEILDYYISKWEKMLSQQDESMEASIGQVYKYEDSLSALGDTFSELIYAHNMGDLNDSDFVEGLKDVRDQVFDTLGSINDLQNTIVEWYGQTLDKAEEELDKYTSKISHSRDVMQTYIEMQQLMGKGADYRALQNMYTFAYESSLENARAAREYVDILKESREVILQQAEEYGWTDTLKQQFDDIEAHIIEAENTLLENTKQTLEDAKAEFENTMSAIIKEVDNAFTALKDANGDLKKSFSEVADEYSFWTEQQGWYVSTAKELYEVSKINRKIEDSIAGATTQQSKERLKLLQEEINAYAEKNRLTEYDIKMNELQYEMALAMQGLEDAGNSKQTVRLTRDENGNYGYQYTADQDEMDAARQKYEDVLQQINELSDEYQKEIAQKWIDAEQQFWEKVQEISQDTTLTVEERQRRIEELTAQHLETMQYYHDEYNKASEQLLTNQGYIQEHYGQTIMANTGMVQDQLNATIDMMIGDTERYMSHITEEALPAISKAMEIYKGDLDATKEATNLSWEAMGDSVQAYRGINQLARQDIQNTDQVLRNTLSGISNATAKWLEHSNSLRTTITSYESLGNSINGIINRLNNVTSAANTAASAIRNMQSASYSSYSGNSSRSSGNNGGGNNSPSGGNKTPTVITKKAVTPKAKNWNTRGIDMPADVFATGGMNDVTGWHWLDGTLQRPELVLNADDTQNMLQMVNILHNLSPEMLSVLRGTVNGSAYSALAGLGAMSAHSINSTTSELNQNVEIHADFPNVTDKNEIIDAFDNLVNLATQYANRKG